MAHVEKKPELNGTLPHPQATLPASSVHPPSGLSLPPPPPAPLPSTALPQPTRTLSQPTATLPQPATTLPQQTSLPQPTTTLPQQTSLPHPQPPVFKPVVIPLRSSSKLKAQKSKDGLHPQPSQSSKLPGQEIFRANSYTAGTLPPPMPPSHGGVPIPPQPVGMISPTRLPPPGLSRPGALPGPPGPILPGAGTKPLLLPPPPPPDKRLSPKKGEALKVDVSNTDSIVITVRNKNTAPTMPMVNVGPPLKPGTPQMKPNQMSATLQIEEKSDSLNAKPLSSSSSK